MNYLVFFFIFLTTLVHAQEKNTVQVQGSCDIKVIPDRGTVTFTAENQNKDQTIAVNLTNKQINQLKDKVLGHKFKDLELKTTNYQVYPVREYEKDKLVEKGMRASLTLEITTSEISKLGELMVDASKIGIRQVGDLTTFLSLEKNREEYSKCLEVAAENARHKAERLAKKLGFKIGDVVSVLEIPNSPNPPIPMTLHRPMMKGGPQAMDMAASSLEVGQQIFSTTLQVSFGIQ